MRKLIIFDFDGTLADTREIIVRTNQEVQRRMGYPITEEADIMATVGLVLEECILTMYPSLPREELPAWTAMYREVFNSLKGKMIPKLFPYVKETMETLWERGFILSVASSRGNESLKDFLRDMGIAPFISYVLGAEDVKQGKPHPEPVLKTLQDLHFDASQALVVGDMPVDIQMGRGAGAKTCGVSYGNSGRDALLQSGADFVIDDFRELLSLTSIHHYGLARTTPT